MNSEMGAVFAASFVSLNLIQFQIGWMNFKQNQIIIMICGEFIVICIIRNESEQIHFIWQLKFFLLGFLFNETQSYYSMIHAYDEYRKLIVNESVWFRFV